MPLELIYGKFEQIHSNTYPSRIVPTSIDVTDSVSQLQPCNAPRNKTEQEEDLYGDV